MYIIIIVWNVVNASSELFTPALAIMPLSSIQTTLRLHLLSWLILHMLQDIIVIAICAVICGAETWDDIEQFGKEKLEWLESILELPNGIPSHDTFNCVFAQINP